MAKKKQKQASDYYVKQGDKLTRKNPSCPKCGPGFFMAVHSNRKFCGKCGYTEFIREKVSQDAQ